MDYAEKLTGLLEPVGVYSFDEGSLSLGELRAVGRELDIAEEAIAALNRESFLATASLDTLQKWEGLLLRPLGTQDPDSLRKALAALLEINQGSFTLAAINRAVAGCGVSAIVTEEGVNQVAVSFPGVMGQPEGLELIKLIVEDILPCHVGIRYNFAFYTWANTRGLTWGQCPQYSWDQLKVLTEE